MELQGMIRRRHTIDAVAGRRRAGHDSATAAEYELDRLEGGGDGSWRRATCATCAALHAACVSACIATWNWRCASFADARVIPTASGEYGEEGRADERNELPTSQDHGRDDSLVAPRSKAQNFTRRGRTRLPRAPARDADARVTRASAARDRCESSETDCAAQSPRPPRA